MTRAGRERVVDALALVALKVALGAWVLHAGFTHVSDDDYARTVIAEQFAHAPRLDPSGTSWLPAPFWLEGAAMMLLGRSLEAARAVAVVLGAASVVAPYLAMRAAGTTRAGALLGAGVGLSLPWNAWLGVATVPEAWTGALVAAAAIAWSSRAARPWAGAALLVASLSRYEAWPACAVAAALTVPRLGREPRRELAFAAIALAGPVAWMAWNAHAHGSPLHFVDRVTSFRLATGGASAPWTDKATGVLRDVMEGAPVAALLGLVGFSSRTGPGWRGWGAGLSAAAIVAFLIVGEVRDGAPTHHPARALLAVWWILVALGVDPALRALRARDDTRGARIAALARQATSAVLVAALVVLPLRAFPGRSSGEDRGPQIRRGLDLRARDVAAVEVTPCSFEHFALLAAWGAPERATVAPRTGASPRPECPGVVEGTTGPSLP